MIPKDRRNHEKRPRSKAKEVGFDSGAASGSTSLRGDSSMTGRNHRKSQAEATLDLWAADFELLASAKRASAISSPSSTNASKGGLGPAPGLRARMVAWARRIVARLSEFGIEVEATWSDEAPLFHGPEHPKKTGTASIVFHALVRKNAILALRRRAKVVEVSVEIYPSVHARAAAGEVARLVDDLPDQFSLGKIDDDNRIPTRQANADHVGALFEGDGGLWLGWSVPREVVLKHAALVGEQLGDAVIALSPVFALVTEIARPATPAFARTLGSSLAGVGAGGAKAKARALEKGAKVRVLSGPFVGKTGVVQELDGRGGAKVMLGLLATRLDTADLVVSNDGPHRPILSSSHRKPLGGVR